MPTRSRAVVCGDTNWVCWLPSKRSTVLNKNIFCTLSQWTQQTTFLLNRFCPWQSPRISFSFLQNIERWLLRDRGAGYAKFKADTDISGGLRASAFHTSLFSSPCSASSRSAFTFSPGTNFWEGSKLLIRWRSTVVENFREKCDKSRCNLNGCWEFRRIILVSEI